jgi:uncharacterized protein YcbK (DUF882 family)
MRIRRAMQAIVAGVMLAGLTCGQAATNSVPGNAGELLGGANAGQNAQAYWLHLYHLHTGESLNIVYRIGDAYVPSAIDQLNHFLRDHRTEDVSHYDLKEFDLLHTIMARLGRPDGVIDIVCGYRTPWSNAFLRHGTPASGVAEHSQHMLAKAIDIRVPGVSTARLRETALSVGAGGVGYYPVSQFVHVDVGPVREWSFGGAPARVKVAHHARGHRHVVRRLGE